MTENEFQRCIAVLIAGVGKPMTADQIDVWRELVSDMTFDEFRRGIVACLRNYKYAGFPSIGLIREAAGVSSGIIDAESQAQLAWAKVLRAIKEVGAYKSVEWDDPAIPVAIRQVAGSWVKLCDQESEQLHKWTSKEFLKAYTAHRTERLDGPAISSGIIAEAASREGYALPSPVRTDDATPAVYGFLGEADVPLLTGPEGEFKSLAAQLVETFPELEREDEPEPTAEEIAEFEAERERRRIEFAAKHGAGAST